MAFEFGRIESRRPAGSTLLAAGIFVAGIVVVEPLAAQPTEESGPSLRILAASSLTEPLRRFAARFESERTVDVDLSFAGSSKLARQIEQGARADVFLSADPQWIDHLVEREEIDAGTRTVFAGNRLVWVRPSDRPAKFSGVSDLETQRPDRLALAGDRVPAGAYARRALRRAGAWHRVADRIVSAENVKRALQWVALGEADAGIVYRSDASGQREVSVAFEFPDRLQPRIAYAGAVVRSSRHAELSRAFLKKLAGPPGRAVLETAGFADSPIEKTDGSGGTTTRVDGDDSRDSHPSGGGVDVWSAIRLSLFAGGVTVLGGLIPAVLLGWVLARRRFPGRSLVATLLLAPLALPPVVTGFILLRLFGTSSLFGPGLAAVGLEVPFTRLAVGLAAFVVSFPLYLLTARSAFELVDRRYEELAATLGDPPHRAFWRVTLPLAGPGLAAGALLAFARAVGEFGATAVVAGNVGGETRTIPLAVYTLLQSPGGLSAIWRLVGVSLVLAFAAVLGFEWFQRRQRNLRGD